MLNKLEVEESFLTQDVKREKLIFTAIFLLALGLRILFLFRIQVIAPDSPNYIYLTNDLIEKGFVNFFSHGFANIFTIYPIFICLMNFLVKDILLSAELVSLIFGTAVIFPLYFIARKLVGVRAGLVTAFFFATHLYLIRYSGEVLKDSTLFFFSVASLYFAFAGTWKRSYLLFFIAGVFSWITVFVRLYGIVLIFAIPFAYLVSAIKDKRSIKEILINLLIFLVPIPLVGYAIFVIFVGPEKEFVIGSFMRFVTGLSFTNNKVYADNLINNIPKGVGDEYVELITSHFFLVATVEFINVLATTFTGFLFFFFVVGIYLDRKNILKDGSRLFLLSFSLPFFLFDYGIIITHCFLSKRQLIPLIIILFPWSAVSFTLGFWWIKDKMSVSTKGLLRWLSRVVIPAIFIIWIVSISLYNMKPYRAKNVYQKESGKYIYEMVGEESVILAQKYDSIVVYYAEGNGVYYHSPLEVRKKLDRFNPDFVLWNTHLDPLPDVFGVLEEEGLIELDRTFLNNRDEYVYIYRVKK
ncbi:MAG: glycosyltransferase family 39 protein [Deltaproteobacteria bacterium]|uniref:Glycosyltransferase family 39 protein n=1 Tax=Candidatus Zymogenus saltonus TaxID=2844893 RepID=A0A9D8PPV3_9DELT|nr:glycosyltransferase family 39 protein [Candidatus Zymogenus saltonus]